MIYVGDLERTLGYCISQIDFSKVSDKPINYHWGNQLELDRYLIWKGENVAIDNALEEDTDKKKYKYPLIWLVLPVTGVSGQGDWIVYRNTRIVIAKNTQSQYFNDTRWNVSFELLSGIANTFLSKVNSKYIQLLKNSKNEPQVRHTKYPNFSNSDNKNKVIDIWDALALDIDLILKTNCITEEILNYDNCRKNRL